MTTPTLTPCPLRPSELRALRAVVATGAQKLAARQLGCSPHTIKNHIDTINRKCNTSSTVTAAVWAVERGWLTDVTTGRDEAGR